MNQTELESILDYLESSIKKLSTESQNFMDFEDSKQIIDFLKNQYEIRLENMLIKKGTSIHQFESKIKNQIIQRRDSLIKVIENDLNFK